MARLEDMHVDIQVVQGSDAVRIAMIDSAVELVTIFANREPKLLPPPEYGSEPSLATEEFHAYRSALAFLQMQYESERTFLYHKEPKL